MILTLIWMLVAFAFGYYWRMAGEPEENEK